MTGIELMFLFLGAIGFFYVALTVTGADLQRAYFTLKRLFPFIDQGGSGGTKWAHRVNWGIVIRVVCGIIAPWNLLMEFFGKPDKYEWVKTIMAVIVTVGCFGVIGYVVYWCITRPVLGIR